MGFKRQVQPGGQAKAAIAELQSLRRVVVTGAAANTRIPVTGLKVHDFIFSAIGVDNITAILADSVEDFTDDIVTDVLKGSITGITLTGSTPVSVTMVAHPHLTGDYVKFEGIVGTTQLNNKIFKVTKTGANTFTLDGTNSSLFTAWGSGGVGFSNGMDLRFGVTTAAYRLIVEYYPNPEQFNMQGHTEL